jgi:EpsI family protein
MEINGFVGQDLAVPDREAEVAGFSNYLLRVFEAPIPAEVLDTEETASTTESPAAAEASAVEAQAPEAPVNQEALLADSWFSLYVGYYESQTRGKTIHSPKNCLPGAGWEPLEAGTLPLEIGGESVIVNRYILQNEAVRSLVLYWYQGRGRIASSEYRVKLHLLLDSALRRRSDEALVRIVVPVAGEDVDSALRTASEAAQVIIPALEQALPGALSLSTAARHEGP